MTILFTENEKGFLFLSLQIFSAAHGGRENKNETDPHPHTTLPVIDRVIFAAVVPSGQEWRGWLSADYGGRNHSQTFRQGPFFCGREPPSGILSCPHCVDFRDTFLLLGFRSNLSLDLTFFYYKLRIFPFSFFSKLKLFLSFHLIRFKISFFSFSLFCFYSV